MAQRSITEFATDSETPEKAETGSADGRPDEFEEWTPKQKENWRNHGQPVFEQIESEEARNLYLRTYRPKKRNDGMMKRDDVSFGDVEHYLYKEVEHSFRPMSSMQGVIMAKMIAPIDDAVDELVDEVVRAKLKVLADENPAAAKRLAKQTERVGKLYGVV